MLEKSRARPAHLVVPDFGVGLGLRSPHYQEILAAERPIGFFEAISENYMSDARKPLYFLDAVRERYPIVLHGVSLSIGGPDELDRNYLQRLKALVNRVRPPWVTDHFCFSQADGSHVHDLLPLPYTREMVERVAARARQVQDFLECPFGLENTSSYLSYVRSEMTEWQFVREVVEEADIGLLFDVNNVYVSAYNHDLDPLEFIRSIPHERILQIHMAGHTNHGTHIIDTHSGPCLDEVIQLYEETIRLTGPAPTLVEWDEDIPSLDDVVKEAKRVAHARARGLNEEQARPFPRDAEPSVRRKALNDRATEPHETLFETQIGVKASAELREPLIAVSGEREAANWRFAGSSRLSPLDQIEIYRDQFWLRHIGSLREDFPGVLFLIGEDAFDELARDYLTGRSRPDYSLRTLGREFPSFVHDRAGDSSSLFAMAALEWAYIHAFEAPETDTLSLSELTRLSPEEWARARFSLAPSVSRLTFGRPIADLRRAILKGDHPDPASLEPRPEYRIVYRHADLGLYDKELTKLAFELLTELEYGTALGAACEKVAERSPGSGEALERGLVPWFREWTELGLLRSFKL